MSTLFVHELNIVHQHTYCQRKVSQRTTLCWVNIFYSCGHGAHMKQVHSSKITLFPVYYTHLPAVQTCCPKLLKMKPQKTHND